MVEVLFETSSQRVAYPVAAGIESLLGGSRRREARRAVGASSFIAVGDGESDIRSASIEIHVKRTDALDASGLTSLAGILKDLAGITIRIDGVDVYHAQVRKSEWAVSGRPAYPWVAVQVDLWLAAPQYVDGAELNANTLEVTANGSTVYVNGDRL